MERKINNIRKYTTTFSKHMFNKHEGTQRRLRMERYIKPRSDCKDKIIQLKKNKKICTKSRSNLFKTQMNDFERNKLKKSWSSFSKKLSKKTLNLQIRTVKNTIFYYNKLTLFNKIKVILFLPYGPYNNTSAKDYFNNKLVPMFVIIHGRDFAKIYVHKYIYVSEHILKNGSYRLVSRKVENPDYPYTYIYRRNYNNKPDLY